MIWPVGDGEMAGRIRAHDWAATRLGPIALWPQCLRTAVDMMLAMPGPATILWGPEHIQLHNDAYIAIARDRHPALLGRPAVQGWPDAYEAIIAPLLATVESGRAIQLTDLVVSLRDLTGRLDERVFDTDWSPIRDEMGGVAGALQTLREVSDRRCAQAALRERTARDRLLFQSWAQAMWETDAHGVVVADSPSWRAYTGQTLEELLGYGWLEAIHPDDRAYAERQWREATAAHRLVDAEFRLRAPNGGWRWTNVRALPVFDAHGRIEKWAGMNIDIDARHRAEAELRESEEKYRTLFDAIDEGLAIVEMIYDEAGTIVDMIFRKVNAAYERQGGIFNVVGRSIRDALPGVEDVWLQRYEELARTGHPIRVEAYQQDVDRWFEVFLSRVDPDGRFVAIVFNDVSERKRAELALQASEARYQALFAASPVPFIVVAPNAPDFTITAVNDAYVAATLSTRGTLIGRRLFDVFVHDPDQPGLEGAGEVARSFERVLATGRTDVMRRVRQDMMTPQGTSEPHWWLGVNAPMFDADGTITAIIHQATRVTEQYRAEGTLRDSEERFRALATTGAASFYRMSPDWSQLLQLDANELVPPREGAETDWLSSHVHADDRGLVAATIAQAIAGRSALELEHRVPLADNSTGWIISRAVPLFDDEGRIREWFGTATDITARKQGEEALLESEELRRIALESGRMGAWEWDTRKATIRSDAVVQALWGVTTAEQPHSVALYADLMRPEGVAWLATVAAKPKMPGEEIDTQLQVATGPTSNRWVQLRGRARRNQPWIINGVTFDITEQKSAEQRLAESETKYAGLFAASPAPFLILKPNAPHFSITEVNDAYLAATRRTRDAVIGRGIFEVFPDNPGDPASAGPSTLLGSLEHVLASCKPDLLPPFKYETTRPDGSFEERWWSPINSPVLNERGTVGAIIHNANDVTDQYRAAVALRDSAERQAFQLQLSDALTSLRAPADIVAEAARLVAGQLDVAWCCFNEFDHRGTHATVLGDHHREGLPSMVGIHDLSDQPDFLALMNAGAVFDLPDLMGSPVTTTRIGQEYGALGMRAALAVPLVRNGGLAAVLLAAHTDIRPWTAGEAELLKGAAERTWAALERARVDEARRRSQSRLRIASEAAELGVWEWDPASDSTSWENDRMFEIFGRNRDEEALSAAKFLGEAVHPDDAERFGTALAAALTSGQCAFTGRFHRSDGEMRWVTLSGKVEYAGDGTPLRMPGVAADVTERMIAETALRESEERFRSFADASEDVLWIVNAATRQLEYVSPAYERIWGEPREAIMADLSEWATRIHPDDLPGPGEGLEALFAGRSFTADYRVRRRDGTTRFVRDTGFPIYGEDGRIRRLAGVAQDLTDRRIAERALGESERRLRTLMEGIPQLVWRADAEGRWTWSSPQWRDFTGQSQEESQGLGWLDAVHPDDGDTAIQALKTALPNGMLDVEYRVRRASDGGYLWHHTRSVPVHEEGGHILEWLGTTTDIHALREMQERQAVLVAELQHRTRNLITVVGALSRQTLRNSNSLSDFDLHFADRLSALSRVQGLLSQLSAGKKVTFDELLGSELTALGAAKDKLTLAGPRGVPLRSATVQTFSLALHELATNALKYGALASPNGHLTVRWVVTHAGSSGPRLQVDWRESGVIMREAGENAPEGGYGRELIERALPYQLDAETTYEMTSDGVHCTIDVPASAPSAGTD